MTIFPNHKKRFALLCVLLVSSFAFSQHTEVTLEDAQNIIAAKTIGSLNSVLFVDGFKYATCQAAVTAAGFANKTIIVIPSSYAGAVCPVDTSYNNPNITILDFSGAMNPSSAPFNGTSYNGNDGNVQWQFRSNFGKQTFGSTNQAIVNGYWITTMTNSTPPVGGTADGISAEMDTFGTLTGTLGNATAAEHSVSVGSTGGTITNASGVLGYVVSGAGSTTTVTNARGVWARGCTTLLGSLPVNCYGIMADDQGNKGSARNYSIYGVGRWLVGYSSVTSGAAIQFEDSTNTARQFMLLDSSGLMNFQSPTATGIALEDNSGNIQALVNGSGMQFRTNSPYPFVAGGLDLGKLANPWANVYLGAAATNNIQITGTATGSRVATVQDQTGTFVVRGGSTSQKSESAADANVLTFTPLAQAGSYRIRFVLSVSAANTATLGWTATWTDSNGNAQAPTNLSLFQSGTAAPALTFTTSAAGNYYGYADIDINNAATNIVIKLTFAGTSFTAKASATVERII